MSLYGDLPNWVKQESPSSRIDMIEIKEKKNRNEQGLRNTNEAKFSGANKKIKIKITRTISFQKPHFRQYVCKAHLLNWFSSILFDLIYKHLQVLLFLYCNTNKSD